MVSANRNTIPARPTGFFICAKKHLECKLLIFPLYHKLRGFSFIYSVYYFVCVCTQNNTTLAKQKLQIIVITVSYETVITIICS